jgi:aspartate kinase
MKFGGTSVGSADAMRSTAKLILNSQKEWGNVVVVASGMGSKPIKVTDLLLDGAYAAADDDGETYKAYAQQLRRIHYTAIDGLLAPEHERQTILAENERFIERYEALCQAVHVLGELSPRALDAIAGMGEQMSVRILAAYLREQGHDAEAIDATEIVVTDSHFQAAAPLFDQTTEKTRARLLPILERGGIPIVTGFIGADENGVTTTLGRGGSDYSGAILGQALAADEVWIWTDVDGVMTADPRIAPNARSIPTLTYREVSELAFYGAKVLHPKTMRPVVEHNIPLRIKNTFNPEHPGTVIVQQTDMPNGFLKAVTAIKEHSLITVEGKGMMGVPGIAARTFGAVAKAGVSVLLISQASSEQSICFATPLNSAETVINGLQAEFAEEIANRDIDRVWDISPVSIITAVSSGIRGTPGIAGKLFTCVGDSGVNIIAIAQGSSECGISIVVEGQDTADAVAAIHELIVNHA